jgi:hypothetical protein
VDPIIVPAPPRAAYNPNRRVSDLILGQLKHFQHVEQKHGKLGIDPALGRDIYTEAGAARYITAITRALRSQGMKAAEAMEAGLAVQPAPAAPASNLAVMPARPAASPALDIAASVETVPADEGAEPAPSQGKK